MPYGLQIRSVLKYWNKGISCRAATGVKASIVSFSANQARHPHTLPASIPDRIRYPAVRRRFLLLLVHMYVKVTGC